MRPQRLAAVLILASASFPGATTPRGAMPAPILPIAPTAASAARDAPASDWTFARADRTVHEALGRWSRQAGWQLVWEVERDFPIDAEVTLRGTFLQALDQAMHGLRDTDFPVQARVQPQTRVVRIVRYLPEGARH